MPKSNLRRSPGIVAGSLIFFAIYRPSQSAFTVTGVVVAVLQDVVRSSPLGLHLAQPTTINGDVIAVVVYSI